MNKQRILKRIGIIFLTFTISVVSFMDTASGQQKNNSTFDNEKSFEVYARGTSYPPNADSDTKKGKTSSLIPIKTVKSLGLECVAVNPKIIPYGSVIIGRHKNGQEIIGVAVDTGGAVKSREAAKNLAKMKGFSEDSPEYKAIVLDFYSTSGDITKYWDTFTIIPYRGPDFKLRLKQSEKVNHLKMIKSLYDGGKLPALTSR